MNSEKMICQCSNAHETFLLTFSSSVVKWFLILNSLHTHSTLSHCFIILAITSKVWKALYIQIMCSPDQIKQSSLIDLYKFFNESFGRNVVVRVVLAVPDYLGKDFPYNVGNGNRAVIGAVVLDQVVDGQWLLDYSLFNLEYLALQTFQEYHLWVWVWWWGRRGFNLIHRLKP